MNFKNSSKKLLVVCYVLVAAIVLTAGLFALDLLVDTIAALVNLIVWMSDFIVRIFSF